MKRDSAAERVARYLKAHGLTTAPPCARPGCPNTGRPKYCSRRCATSVTGGAITYAKRVEMAHRAHAVMAAKGIAALRPMELRLMAAGRFREAARAIYDRGYSAGWIAGREGRRQLPERKASVA